MGDTSEREFLDRLIKIRTKASKKGANVKNDIAKMQKLKASALKNTEEMIQKAEQDIEKLERDMVKNKDLVPESIQRLNAEIALTKEQVMQKYKELKTRVTAAIVPV